MTSHTAASVDQETAEIEQLRRRVAELETMLREKERNEVLNPMVERLRILHEIDHAILASHPPREIALVAISHICRLLSCTRGSVALFDFENQVFRVLAAYDEGETQYRTDYQAPLDEFGADFQRLREGANYREDDLRTPSLPSASGQALLKEGILSYINIPLIAREELIGTLNIGANRPHAFDSMPVEIAEEAASQIAIAIQQAHLAEEARRKNLELTGLYETAVATSGVSDMDEVLSHLNEQVQRLFTPDSFIVTLYEANKAEFQIVLAIEEGQVIQEWKDARMPLQEGGLTGWVIQNRQSLLVKDMLHDELPVEPKHSMRPARAWLGVPLISRSQLVGAFSIQSFRPHAYNESHQRLLETLARQVAASIQNTRLFTETKENLLREQRLAEITYTLSTSLDLSQVLHNVTRLVTELVNADAGAIALLAPDGESMTFPYLYNLPDQLGLKQAPRGHGLAWSVVSSGKSFLIPDYEAYAGALPDWVNAGVKAMLAVPVFLGEKCTGALGLIKFSTNQPFCERDQKLVEAVGRVAGVAIQNAALFEGVERNLQRLTALRTIDLAITTSPDLETVLRTLLEQVTDQLRVDAADVLLFDRQYHTLKFAAGRGFITNAMHHTNLCLGAGFAGQAALQGSPVHVPDLRATPNGLKLSASLDGEEFVTYHGTPLTAKGQVVGVLEIFHRSPLKPTQEWYNFLEALAGQTAIAVDNATLFQDLQNANEELNGAYTATLEGWARVLELRDFETQGHSQRVTDMTLALGRKLGLGEEELVPLRYGALLHDIGKLGIPDAILLKPGQLSEEEKRVMQNHTTYAYKMLSPIAFLKPALDIPSSHHEKWDGTGYPRGLSGEQIPLAARIFAVVDVWDALRSDRPYRRAWNDRAILDYIRGQSGKHFDPGIVSAFLDLLKADQH